MNYSAIKPVDVANGPGVRVSLFVSGCTRHCPGCFNRSTWDFCAGQPFTDSTENVILDHLRPEYIAGLSILGGEPFEKPNQKALIPFLRRVRAAFPDKTIWAWSGFTLDELKANGSGKMLELLDVLVDGPFIEQKKDISLLWRGSSNQKIHDFKES